MHLSLKSLSVLGILSLFTITANAQTNIGHTEVTKWQYGKNGALSITYDDGNINQFKYALPIMERLKLPATFFIITGGIPGSMYHGKFVGRPVKDIINESATFQPVSKTSLSAVLQQGI
jgi:peptidoglycan/xylan/chitin deacetylase (PgdA/CDA1 family)